MTLVWRGEEVKAKAKAGAVRGLLLWAEDVSEKSSREVPLQEGTLMRSRRASVDASQMKSCTSYDTPYAADQHEDLTKQHPRGRKAKYLENPANSTKKTGPAIVAREIKRSLGA
ncbi:MAG: minor capsid protein [Phycisphaerales bacterium]